MTDEDDNSSPSKEIASEVKKDTAAVFRSIPEKVKSHIKNKPWFVCIGGGLLALVILLLVLGLGFRQKTSHAPTAQWQEYYSDTLGFSISHPANWTVTEADAASGPDILIAEQNGNAFVRIRGLLDVNLNNTEAIQTSLDQYQKTLALQPDVRITNVQSQAVGEHITEFTMTGEFPVTGSTFNFEERGVLTTTGRALLMRAADLPDNIEISLPTMRKIVDSFTVEQRSNNAMFDIPKAFASDTPQQPLASMGNVTFSITDYQANTVEPTDSRARLYTSALQGHIVNAGIPLGVQSRMRDQLIQLREENNQLNQERGGRHLITGQNGDTFWGYKKYTGNLPEPTYRIDANINVFHRDASGETQDLLVSVRIYDASTGQLVGTAQASRKNTQRIQNKQIVGPEPTWWQKYISGYAREVTYEDILSTVISEASAKTANQLSALSNQEIVSDAQRFTQSLEENGYKPLLPKTDEASRDSALDISNNPDRDPNCPYFYATGTIDGPRTCFQTQAELNAALGIDSAGNPLGEPNLNNLFPSNTTPSDIYIDQNLVDYINWSKTIEGGNPDASRQSYIEGQREAYRNQPVPGYGSEEDYIQAFTQVLDQSITTGQGADNNVVPEYGPGPLWGQGLDYSGNQQNTYNDAYTNETNSNAYDGFNTGTYQGPSGVTTESR